MKRNIIVFTLLSVAFFVVNAQSASESSLSRLNTQCNKVVELENSIASKQATLSNVNNSINNLRQLWLEICVEYFNNPNSTTEDFADLLAETDSNEESELYKDLEWAKDHPSMNERRSRPQGDANTKNPSSSGKSNKDKADSDTKSDNTHPKVNDTKDTEVDSKAINADNPAPVESAPKNDSKLTKDEKKVEESIKVDNPKKDEDQVKVENPDKKKEDITKKTEESSGQDKGSIVRNRKNKTGNNPQ